MDAVIEKLRLFLVILEEGSLRRTAERMHISQSAITRQIQLLEHDLGGQILERTPTGVRPTTGGHILAGKARLLLDDYDSVMAEVLPHCPGGKAIACALAIQHRRCRNILVPLWRRCGAHIRNSK